MEAAAILASSTHNTADEILDYLKNTCSISDLTDDEIKTAKDELIAALMVGVTTTISFFQISKEEELTDRYTSIFLRDDASYGRCMHYEQNLNRMLKSKETKYVTSFVYGILRDTLPDRHVLTRKTIDAIATIYLGWLDLLKEFFSEYRF
jgi:hypothetical protein